MKDDDLDLDLDLGPEVTPVPKKPAPSAVGGSADAAHKPAQVMTERKPGVFSKVGAQVSDSLAHLAPPAWTLRNFALVLAVLVALLILGTNWAPVRLYLLGLRLELPKAVAFMLNVALGWVLAWWWLRRQHEGRG